MVLNTTQKNLERVSLRYSTSNIPEVSVVVCHHTGELLYDFLTSLKHCTIPIEVIVMTSDDELASEGIKGCLVMHSTDMPATKRNRAARMAKGKYLAIFDDDVEITPGCIEEMLSLINSKKEIGMVYGKLYKYDEPNRFDEAGGYITNTGFIWSRAGQNIVDNGQYDQAEPIFSGKSASCLVRRDLWLKLGGMDEEFGILGEESDLSWRIWISGYEVWWCPNSVALHKFNTPLKPVNKYYTSSRVHYNGCRNYITMLIKNLGVRNLWIVPLHMLIWFTASIAMIGTGKAEQGWNIMRGIGFVLRNLRKILRKRKEIQWGRIIDDRNVWATISRTPRWSYYFGRLTKYISIGLHG